MGYRISDPSLYQELKWSVVNAFRQLGYIRLPVEPSELFEAHGIQTLAYQIAYDSSASLDDLMMLCRCPSGISFTLTTDEHDYRFIACNLQEAPGRVRFTKLHEAGHLLRGHLRDSELAEIEANFWAKYAIAPQVLIEELGLTTAEEISQHFGTSLECASNILSQHANWLRHRHDDEAIDASILELYARGLLLEGRDEKQPKPAQILQ